MKSLAETTDRNAKRRKLHHVDTKQPILLHSHSKPALPAPSGGEEEEEDDEDEDEKSGSDPGDEAGEAAEDAGPEELFDYDDDDEADAADPFETHFSMPDENTVSASINAIEKGKWHLRRELMGSSRVFLHVAAIDGASDIRPPGPVSKPLDLKLKKKLAEAYTAKRPGFDAAQQLLAPFLFNYLDTLFCQRTLENADSLRRLTLLHALNHTFK